LPILRVRTLGEAKGIEMIRNIGINQSNVLINETSKNEQKAVTKKGENQTSRLDKLKEQIRSGEYKIDLKAIATKMAQEFKPE